MCVAPFFGMFVRVVRVSERERERELCERVSEVKSVIEVCV